MTKFLLRKRFNNRYSYLQGFNLAGIVGAPIWTANKDQAKQFDNPADAYDAAVTNGIEGYVISPLRIEVPLPEPQTWYVLAGQGTARPLAFEYLAEAAAWRNGGEKLYRVRMEFLEEL